jgi:hypothetical protein
MIRFVFRRGGGAGKAIAAEAAPVVGYRSAHCASTQPAAGLDGGGGAQGGTTKSGALTAASINFRCSPESNRA